MSSAIRYKNTTKEIRYFREEKSKFYSECEILGHPYSNGTCQVCGKVEKELRRGKFTNREIIQNG